jgi:hypothetical protein
MKNIILPFMGALLVFMIFTLAQIAVAQETQYTYCEGPNGQVVIVTNHTCPPGFWRT